MNRETFGFGAGRLEKGGNRIEGEIKTEEVFDLKSLVEPHKDQYLFYRNKFVQVRGQRSSIIGVYLGIRHPDVGNPDAIFNPVIRQKAVDRPTRKDPDRTITYLELLYDFASMSLSSIEEIIPYDEEYIMERIRTTQDIAGIARIIIPNSYKKR
ncbi:hypothetical protein J4229_02885 [Candidatus Pacearchaeota archaeon]|nr:hypothetical protein [Candidatus Pacearchaeota archaeon]